MLSRVLSKQDNCTSITAFPSGRVTVNFDLSDLQSHHYFSPADFCVTSCLSPTEHLHQLKKLLSSISKISPSKQQNRTSVRQDRLTHLRWWKSWNSGEGRKGRWYPQWEMVVLTRATQYHMEVVDTWEPRRTGPLTTGNKLEI